MLGRHKVEIEHLITVQNSDWVEKIRFKAGDPTYFTEFVRLKNEGKDGDIITLYRVEGTEKQELEQAQVSKG